MGVPLCAAPESMSYGWASAEQLVLLQIKLRNPSLLRQLQAIPQRLPGDAVTLQANSKASRLSATGA